MPSLRYRRLWRAGSWVALIVIAVLSLMPAPPQPPVISWDKAQHALAYAMLGGAFVQAWEGRFALRWGVFLVAVGVALELLQGLSATRMFEWADMAANTVGVSLGVGLALGTPLGGVFAATERLLLVVTRS